MGKDSPLTDYRSLGASAVFHLALLLLASVAAFGVGAPRMLEPPPVLSAEIGPVDNRAPLASGGGSPGDLGGTSSEAVRLTAEARSVPGRDAAAADQLLAESTPAPRAKPEIDPVPSGPPTTGIGLMEGAGSGGGGGSGGGSGSGTGKGVGPGTEFFGAKERASSFAYVIDCSGSMSNRNAIRIAKAELLSSLDRLPPDAKFTVVFYNIKASAFADGQGQSKLMAATRENKDRLRTRLTAIRSDGGTDHAVALRTAFAMKPEAIFFLTDAERLEGGDIEALREQAGTIRIHGVEFGDGPASGGESPLRNLSASTGGTFRHIDLSAWIGAGAAKPASPETGQ